MPVVFKMDFSNLKQKVLESALMPVAETTNAVYWDVRLFSPIDTWDYVSGHRNKWVRMEKNRVIWEVENVGDHSERVESWFKKNAVNWHLKNLWQIYFSKWANVYWKAVAKNKDIFLRKLQWQ